MSNLAVATYREPIRGPVASRIRLSITTTLRPTPVRVVVRQVDTDWWVIMIRDDIRNGDLIPAYIRQAAHISDLWARLTAVFGVDPIATPGLAWSLYPPHHRPRVDLIPDMEDAGILWPWPHGRPLRP